MKTFLRCNPSEVANHNLTRRSSRLGVAARALIEAVEVDSERHDVHLAFRDSKIAAHLRSVELANRVKPVDKLDTRPDQLHCFGSIWLAETIDKQVFALQRAEYRNIHVPLYRP